jgi:hypothetical protein
VPAASTPNQEAPSLLAYASQNPFIPFVETWRAVRQRLRAFNSMAGKVYGYILLTFFLAFLFLTILVALFVR